MEIQNRFSDNLMASVRLNSNLVAGLKVANATGPITLPVTLKEIADSVQINLTGGDASASHARPSMLANISSFTDSIAAALNAVTSANHAQKFAELSAHQKRDFAEWQGIVAAIALSSVYSASGLNLSVETIKLDVDKPAHMCLLLEMAKDEYFKDLVNFDSGGKPVGGRIFQICQNNVPFAIYHPAYIACPMQTYDASIFSGVISWMHLPADQDSQRYCHNVWLMDSKTGSLNLEDFCLSRIAWWAGRNGRSDYEDFLTGQMKEKNYNLSPLLVSKTTISHSTDIDVVPAWKGKGETFGTTMMFYLDEAGEPKPMSDVFMPHLFLAIVGAKDNNCMIFNTKSGTKPMFISGNHMLLDGLVPVAPFQPEFIRMTKTVEMEDMQFEADITASKLQSITVTVWLKTSAGERFSISNRYKYDQIFVGKIPYLMTWPFVPQPKNMKLIHSYYATWTETNYGIGSYIAGNGEELPLVRNVSFSFEDQGVCSRICRKTGQNSAWDVCKSEEPFRYAVVHGLLDDNQKVNLGLLFMPEIPTYDPNVPNAEFHVKWAHNPIRMAVDFGTTSTVCALQDAGVFSDSKPFILPFKDYSKTVTCSDYDAQRKVSVDRWLGINEFGKDFSHAKKIFSVAQIFERLGEGAAGYIMNQNQEYYIDGRLYLFNGQDIMNLAANSGSDMDPLQEKQIMTDMKFGNQVDPMNMRAACVFLAGVYTYAILYLLDNRILPVNNRNIVDMRISYPNDVTLRSLRQSWTDAYGIVATGILDASLAQPIQEALNRDGHFINEATATAAYQTNPAFVAGFMGNNVVSMDIGGGTTDISITHQNYPLDVRNLSFRYAGREMMVASIIQYFRRFRNAQPNERELKFASLWDPYGNVPTNGNIKSMVNSFCQNTQLENPNAFSLQYLRDKQSLRMCIEMLLNNGLYLKPMQNSTDNDIFRQLIVLKFLMSLKIAARMIKENLDLWIDPLTGSLAKMGNKLNVNIMVSGTSAQLLQYVFDCPITTLNGIDDRTSGKIGEFMQKIDALLTKELSDKLPEGVSVDLAISVSTGVVEKREVSFGMLSSNISAIVSNVRNRQQQMTQQQRDEKVKQRAIELNRYGEKNLMDYLSSIREYIDAYTETYFAYPQQINRGLGFEIMQVMDILQDCSKSFFPARQMVASSKSMYMVEPEQEKYLDLLSGMYMVEEILNLEIARLQLQ